MSKPKQKPSASNKTSASDKPKGKGTAGKNRLPKEKAKPKMPETKRQALLAEKNSELSDRLQVFRDSEHAYELAHERASGLKKVMELNQIKLNDVAVEISDILSGNYQPRLPFGDNAPSNNGAATNGKADQKPPATPAVDEGAKMPLSALLEFKHPKTGKALITKGKVELVREAVGATVGDLEKFQRENPYDWITKIKGLGADGSGSLTDAMVQLRKKHPMPDPVLTASEKAAKGNPESTEQRAERLGCEAALANKPRENPYPAAGPEQTQWFAGYDKTKAGPGKQIPQVPATAKPVEQGTGADQAPKDAAGNPIPDGPAGASARNRAQAGHKNGVKEQPQAGEGSGDETPR